MADLQKGLIAHWPLTDKYSDATYDAKDATPNGNHGTGADVTVGATYTESNGTNSVISLGDFIFGSGDLTISLWFYPQGEGELSNESILRDEQFIILWNDTNDWLVIASDGSTYKTSAINSFPVNTWYHLTITRTSAGITNIYKDSVITGTADQSTGTPADGTTAYIFSSNAEATFDGYISDIRIYNRILTTDEISLLYRMGSGAGSDSEAVNLGANLTAHYPLTSDYVDGSGFPLDLGSGGNDATSLEGDASITVDGAVFVDDGDYIPIPSRTYDIDGSPTSFVFWTNAAAGTTQRNILGNSVNPSFSTIGFNGTESLRMESDTNGQITYSAGSQLDGLWNMFTIVCDGAGNAAMWKNATSLAMTASTFTGDITLSRISEPTADFTTIGTLQNIRIYENRALTQADVNALYAQGRHAVRTTGSDFSKGLIAHWPLTDQYEDGTYGAKDATPRGNHGTITGTVTIGSDYATFAGETDYIEVPDPADGSLDFGTGAFSISLWFRTDYDCTQSPYMITKNDTVGSPYEGYVISLTTDGYLRFNVSDADGDDIGGTVQQSVAQNNNVWHHFVGTWDGATGSAWGYVDGAYYDNGINTDIGSISNDGAIRIGTSFWNPASSEWHDDLADIRIYNRVWSAAEALEYFRLTRGIYGV